MNKGVDLVHIYNKLHIDIEHYIKNKNIEEIIKEYEIVNINDDDFKDNDDYIEFKYVEEDKLDKFLCDNNYNFQKDSLITFNTNIYIIENLKSYNYSTNRIWKQFILDCPRDEIYIENKLIKNKTDFEKSLSFIKKSEININSHSYELITLMAMLCSQSSYAFPIIFLQKIQHHFNKDLYLTNLNKSKNININIESNRIIFILNLDIGVKNIDNNEIVSKLNVNLILELNKVNDNYIFSTKGIFFIK
jgi:hypothetical protein